MKREDLPVLLFAVIMAGAVLVAIAGDITTSLCQGIDLEKLNEGRPVFGCREFWFNRYQTTAQTILSAAIGVVGLYFVVRQLREISAQNEMTRRALEANTEQYRIAQLSLAGKARAAISLYAGGAGTLMMEGIAAMADLPTTAKSPDYEFLGKVSASLPDIFPVLTSPEISAEWRSLRSEYETLNAYILLHRTVRNPPKEAMTAHLTNSPKSLAEAVGRATALGPKMHAFGANLDP